MSKLLQSNCVICGKTFSHYKSLTGRYCSVECCRLCPENRKSKGHNRGKSLSKEWAKKIGESNKKAWELKNREGKSKEEKRKEYGKIYREKNREKIRNQRKSVYNKEKTKERFQKWKVENIDKYRSGVLKRQYGISLDDYIKMLKKQKGVCKICKKESMSNRSLAVDHNHTTGKIRGLLCTKCNNGLGNFDDSVALLKSAIKYLKQDNEN